ncbi:helix-turn-helix domain-containing protein, partial [Pseudomonas sp. BAY1663]|uniref:helix-turn-helix domain-containing protein n=1 Tax=Pseudomonas sp. BAY1663 TaxID=1439940 RepID=UPI000686132E
MTAPHPESAAPVAMGSNPGETLRSAREGKGLTLSAVAQQLNLTERALARIEAGDFSQLPGHTFARGYVRAYAKLLGLDQNRLVQEFDQHTGTDASGSSVTSLGRIEEPGRLSRNVMRFFGFALLLVLAGAAFYWWQERAAREESAPAVTALERIEVESADGTTQIHMLDRAEDSEPAEEAPLPLADEAAVDAPQAVTEPVEPATSEPAAEVPAEP